MIVIVIKSAALNAAADFKFIFAAVYVFKVSFVNFLNILLEFFL